MGPETSIFPPTTFPGPITIQTRSWCRRRCGVGTKAARRTLSRPVPAWNA